jgi:hypothetical protein
LPDTSTIPPHLDHLLPVEYFLRPANRQILPRSALDGLPHSSGPEILLVAQPAGLDSLPDKGSFELGRGAQNVEQEPRGRIPDIGIEALRHRNEADSLVIQESDVVQAVNQRSPKAVQFPDQQASELP